MTWVEATADVALIGLIGYVLSIPARSMLAFAQKGGFYALWDGVGRVSRVGFFICAPVGLGFYAYGSEFPSLRTPIAQLTLAGLAGDLGRLALIGIGFYLIAQWAFWEGERDYATWATVGLIGFGVAILILASTS